jgi:integrase
MKARQDRLKKLKPTCNLIFPNSLCTPEKNLLRRVRRAAKRAGITDRIALHNLRKTYATYIAKELGIEAARVFLGHADIKTTQAYLGTGVDRAEATRAANKMAEKFGGSK